MSGGRRRRDGAARTRVGHQWLDPGAGLVLRRVRAEADLRAALAGGSFPFVASLGYLGPLARTVGDLALAYDAMQRSDPDDPVAPSACPSRSRCCSTAAPSGCGLRAGGWFAHGAGSEALAAVARVAAALGVEREIVLSEASRARSAAHVISAAEGAAVHLDRLRERAGAFDPDLRDRLLAGALLPAPLVVQAQKFRRWYREQVLTLFADVDAILAPVTPCVAPRLGSRTFVVDGREVPLRPNVGLYTQPISFIALPVVAVPQPIEVGLPIGVQIIAAPWREDVKRRIARALQAAGREVAPRPPRG